ncbi:hypothetical protein Sgly_1297 [Syntrophobotulus glycolicus DSM 8271]|uniref:Uncharacterized protein n=1 Tax=Syntrophobotulus glycolicus (strain DSM 8271 / FlGlyR) TaxID=645991 RepID=F0SVA7_SYNGF|nr:hypothetical protein [Syntrophobotulus glycolicus]ADY55607.1 hypothetical protein Sgly_1297 [Syntrophobotulus glycolicus DSM 8271]
MFAEGLQIKRDDAQSHMTSVASSICLVRSCRFFGQGRRQVGSEDADEFLPVSFTLIYGIIITKQPHSVV